MSDDMAEMLQIAPQYQSPLAAAGLANLDAVFGFDRGERLDKTGLESWRQRWRVRLPDGPQPGGTLYLKRFDSPPLRRQWERWRTAGLRRSTAAVEWENANQLAMAGVAATQAVAMGQRMCGPFEQRSFVLLAEVPGESLERWAPTHLSQSASACSADRANDGGIPACAKYRRDLIEQLARFVGGFHRAGFVHRDLYLSHIFIEEHEREGGAAAFRLIDLQRVFRPRWRHRRWVVKDLAALDVSTPREVAPLMTRLRFLCRYVRACPGFGSSRALARLVGCKSDLIRRRLTARQGGQE